MVLGGGGERRQKDECQDDELHVRQDYRFYMITELVQ
jgi:hypothetical protein